MIDKDRIVEMMDGDTALAEKLIQSFKEQVSRQLPLMHQYLQDDDRAMLSNSAHIMKTQVSYLGLIDLADIARQIEEGANNAYELSALRPLFTRLESQLTHLINTELS